MEPFQKKTSTEKCRSISAEEFELHVSGEKEDSISQLEPYTEQRLGIVMAKRSLHPVSNYSGTFNAFLDQFLAYPYHSVNSLSLLLSVAYSNHSYNSLSSLSPLAYSSPTSRLFLNITCDSRINENRTNQQNVPFHDVSEKVSSRAESEVTQRGRLLTTEQMKRQKVCVKRQDQEFQCPHKQTEQATTEIEREPRRFESHLMLLQQELFLDTEILRQSEEIHRQEEDIFSEKEYKFRREEQIFQEKENLFKIKERILLKQCIYMKRKEILLKKERIFMEKRGILLEKGDIRQKKQEILRERGEILEKRRKIFRLKEELQIRQNNLDYEKEILKRRLEERIREQIWARFYEELICWDDDDRGASREMIDRNSLKCKYEIIRRSCEENDTDENCSICLCEFEDNQIMRRLQCTHLFHIECVDQWLSKKNRCPICRLGIDHKQRSSAVSL